MKGVLELIALAEPPQGCSSKFPTWGGVVVGRLVTHPDCLSEVVTALRLARTRTSSTLRCLRQHR